MQQDLSDGSGRDVLRREEATGRSSRVSDVGYRLAFDLSEGRSTYDGRATITFALDRDGDGETPSFLDFSGHLLSAVVNGAEIDAEHRAHRIWLPPELLRDDNEIRLTYRNDFDATGDGFHRFVDPEDGAEYLYSNLEPFSAHRLFPCFDQPDLKAAYALEVIAPRGWSVISAEPADRREEVPDGRTRHEFALTPPISTYVFPLIAGPYARIGSEREGVRLGLFGRRSMEPELERSADELFEVTAAGMAHFRELFGVAYPFTKYDQVFVPEFNAGAMENVGAVTFHDHFLFRDRPTYGQRLVRGEVILHELAHMWFGNLVTMRWWDDLWLNETFATYLSYRCLADATRFSDAWHVFNGQMRPAAYHQDQLRTTHPIAADVLHTDQAVGNFDAITYEKGAAVIKQLVAALGEDAFLRGLHSFIERHSWANATLPDLLAALGEAAGRPLDEWARVWLRTPSLNTLGVEWSAVDGVVASMLLRQDAPEAHPTLRPHSTVIGMVNEGAPGEPLSVAEVPVDISTASVEVSPAIGAPAPSFVFPNLGDHDYALARLDPTSLRFALERLPELPDLLLRQQVWSTLWQMVRDVESGPLDFMGVLGRFAPSEDDAGLLQAVVDHAVACLSRYVPEPLAGAASNTFIETALDVTRSSTKPDVRIIWTRAAIAAAGSAADLERLLGASDGIWSMEGFEPDQEMRWSLAVKAMAHGLDDAEERLAIEAERDRSDRGRRAQLRAYASRPDARSKQEAWERINGPGYGSDYLTRAAIAGFRWGHQRELLEPFRERFFERMRAVYDARDHAFAQSYVRWLVPDRWAEAGVLERLRSESAAMGDRHELLRRQLDEIADDMERAIRVQARALVAV